MLQIWKYSMKFAFQLSFVFLLISFSVPPVAECIDKNRREEWPLIKNASVQIGDKRFNVYQDPKNPSHVFVYPDCWLIRRYEKKVVMPNCTYEMVGEKLYFDKTWRDPKGYVTGVEWGDPKMSNISFFPPFLESQNLKVTP